MYAIRSYYVDDPGIAEAVLNRAREEAPPDALPRLTRAFEDLGIADRYLRALTESTSWEERVITSYSIHYTKLYDANRRPRSSTLPPDRWSR